MDNWTVETKYKEVKKKYDSGVKGETRLLYNGTIVSVTKGVAPHIVKSVQEFADHYNRINKTYTPPEVQG